MQVIAVDDERIALELLTRAILAFDEDISLHTFGDPYKALECAMKEDPDVAFVDVNMFGMNGVDLARKLKEIKPTMNVIFTTGYSEYMEDAFMMHASGYILKPITPAKVRKELENLRYPVTDGKKSKVNAHCFGNFELFVDGRVLNFKYSKTRELLAYLVDRKGTSCTSAEITAVLWESGTHDSYLRNMRKDLTDTLNQVGCAYILNNGNGRMNVVKGSFECDYYDWLEDHSKAEYTGEYMSQYSWAEETNAYINRQMGKE